MTFTIQADRTPKTIVVTRYYNKKKTRLKRRVEKELTHIAPKKATLKTRKEGSYVLQNKHNKQGKNKKYKVILQFVYEKS